MVVAFKFIFNGVEKGGWYHFSSMAVALFETFLQNGYVDCDNLHIDYTLKVGAIVYIIEVIDGMCYISSENIKKCTINDYIKFYMEDDENYDESDLYPAGWDDPTLY